MTSDISSSKKFIGALFLKRTKQTKGAKQTISLINDYRILLLACFLWGLPYTPGQLRGKTYKENTCWTIISLILNVCKMLVSIFSICYSSYVLPKFSLALTYNMFIFLCLLVNLCLLWKRKSIILAVKSVIAVGDQVNPRNFKSKWNVRALLILSAIGSAVFCTTSTLINIRAYDTVDIKSVSFLWYKVGEVHGALFRHCLSFAAAVTFFNCCAVGSMSVVIACMAYFHLGDIITNFGCKLRSRLGQQTASQYSLSENLYTFQCITHLNRVIDEAFSTIALVIYAGLMAAFFTGVGSIRELRDTETDHVLLILNLLVSALFYFILITKIGDRIVEKDQKLKEIITDCTRLIMEGNLSERAIMWFNLMSNEMRSTSMKVRGGNMFDINDQLILSVAGTLITYGVLIFQID